MIDIKYGFPFFIKNENKYNLTKNKISNITDDDFTFLVRVKTNWKKMKPNDVTSDGGVIMKNGQHIGIVARKYIGDDEKEYCAYGAGVFTDLSDDKNFFSSYQLSENPDDFENLSMSHIKSKKLIVFRIDDKKFEFNYEGNIRDYSNSWIWIGAGCGFSDYPEEHKFSFDGSLQTVAIFDRYLVDQDIIDYFSEFNNIELVKKKYEPLFFTNFSNTTPYKIKDESGNGHNLIKSGFVWIYSL